MSDLWLIITTIFSGCWRLLTSIRFFGVSPVELCFACLLLWFVIKKVIKPIFGGGSDDSNS